MPYFVSTISPSHLAATVHHFDGVKVLHHAFLSAEAENLMIRDTFDSITYIIAELVRQAWWLCIILPCHTGKVEHMTVLAHLRAQIPASHNEKLVEAGAVRRDWVLEARVVEPRSGAWNKQFMISIHNRNHVLQG